MCFVGRARGEGNDPLDGVLKACEACGEARGRREARSHLGMQMV